MKNTRIQATKKFAKAMPYIFAVARFVLVLFGFSGLLFNFSY